jgi:hypothetical protein
MNTLIFLTAAVGALALSNVVPLTRRRLGVIGALVALMAAGGVAYATIPSASGKLIHICFKQVDTMKQNGTPVTIVDSDSASCKEGYTELAFNQQGVQGAPGPQGEQGPPGPAGAGFAGLDAIEGLTCNTGDAAQGVVDVSYDLTTEVVTFKCKPTNLVRLTVTAAGNLNTTSYECGDLWTPKTCYTTTYYSMLISVLNGTTSVGTCQTGYQASSTTCSWLVPKDSSLTLSGGAGTWSGACTGTAPDCSVTMNEAKSVTKRASIT